MSKLGAYTHSMQCSRFSAEKVRPLARTFQVPVRRYKNLIRDISDFCKVSLEQGTCISISFQQYHFELETWNSRSLSVFSPFSLRFTHGGGVDFSFRWMSEEANKRQQQNRQGRNTTPPSATLQQDQAATRPSSHTSTSNTCDTISTSWTTRTSQSKKSMGTTRESFGAAEGVETEN